MTLKELRSVSSNQYELLVVTVKHILEYSVPEHDIHEVICGTSRDDEVFAECDYYPVAKWEIKIGEAKTIPYLSVLVIHEESKGT